VPSLNAIALLEFHRDNNRKSAARWSDFSPHRARMTTLALERAGGQSVALLGAGNCNDLDLPALATAYREVHLVDIDREALQRARERLPVEVANKLMLRAPVDLSGVFDRLARLRGKTLSGEELAGVTAAAADRVLVALPERFDQVVSCCLMSQLMHSCYLALDLHPQLEAIGAAVAAAHLRSLVGLARPGGGVAFVSDTVSSESYPLEELWGERPPLRMLEDLEAAGNVQSGTAPTFVRRRLKALSADLAGPPRLIEPWLWRLDDSLTFLVYALVLRRLS
jgi:hypothetical protein